jgi:NAD(P)-dependent dehydrogenase (short-subunit alcohol dehydrogenase family)
LSVHEGKILSQVVLITGCSSGIGRASAYYFAARGWQVVATMRDEVMADDLARLPGVTVLPMDVCDTASVEHAVSDALARLGRIDVLVNNAGFGAFGPFETAPEGLVERQFDTNVMGVMRVSRAVLPVMRKQGRGVIVNIASIGGLVTMPLNAIYHATKYAVVGFTEALYYELAPFGLRAKVVAPGGVATDFAGRSLSLTFEGDGGAYAETIARVTQAFRERRTAHSQPDTIAAVVYRAATDCSDQVLYVAGADAEALRAAHSSMPESEYLAMMQQRFGLDS